MSKVFIASHYDGRVGGLDSFIGYLEQSGHEVVIMLHPLDNYASIQTNIIRARKDHFIPRRPRGKLNLLEDLLISLKIVRSEEIQNYVGASNFDTLPAIIRRYIFRQNIDQIIYYPRDFSVDRYTNKFLNYIYRQIEKIAVRHSDLTISNSTRAAEARKMLGLKSSKSIVIPNPVKMADPEFIKKEINKRKFIYAGDISPEHGLLEIIEALKRQIECLEIIGSGTETDKIRALASSHGIPLILHGYMPHEKAIELLQKFNGMALAPYNLQKKWTFYCSPLKVSEYIACGLPVVISDVPEIAQTVKLEGLGIVFPVGDTSEICAEINSYDTRGFNHKAKVFYENNTPHLWDVIKL
jgi:glycosyltransferase involved in cell wall biosynthesis